MQSFSAHAQHTTFPQERDGYSILNSFVSIRSFTCQSLRSEVFLILITVIWMMSILFALLPGDLLTL